MRAIKNPFERSLTIYKDKEARWCAFAHDVPTRAYQHSLLNCQPNHEITKIDIWV